MDCPYCGSTCTCSVPSQAAGIPLPRGPLATFETVDTPGVSIPSVETRARMQSAESDDSRVVNDVSQSATGPEAWRELVASRVNSYRARGKRKNGENLPALDFGSSSAAANAPTAGYVPQGRAIPQPPAESSSRAARNPFDTNYYRRLNAESLSGAYSQGSNALMGAPDAAPEPLLDAESVPELKSAFDILGDLSAPADDAPALDLDLRTHSEGDAALDRYRISEPEPEPEMESQPESEAIPEPTPEPMAAPATQGNLIVFRRPLLEPPLVPQPSRDELAEPMHNRPRILEVPEDIMPAVQGSLFPEIRLDADESESSAPREPQIEVPLSVAQVSDRFAAGLMDLGVVMAASLLFDAIAWYALPEVPHAKPFFMVLGVVTFLLWAVYQHLFLLYAGRTLGMSMRGLRLSTFEGHAPEWKQRSSRARFMFISMAPVMLGFLWAMVDEDMLCWHDRISRTFPTTS